MNGQIDSLFSKIQTAFAGIKRLREKVQLRNLAAYTDDPANNCNVFTAMLSCRDWELAARAVELAGPTKLDGALCGTLKLIWFLTTEDELQAAFNLISLIISLGASDFRRAVLETTLFVSLIPVCQRSRAGLATAFTKRWHGNTDPENIPEMLTQLEWTLRKCQVDVDRFDRGKIKNSPAERQRQLCVFERFLNLTRNQLTKKDFNDALVSACLYHIALSNTDWALPISATAVPNLLDMFVKRGAYSVMGHIALAAGNRCIDLVRILLQIDYPNGFRPDVNLAFWCATFNWDVAMMECLDDELVDDAVFFIPFMGAVFVGCIHVVQWFVQRGLGDDRNYCALIVATCNSQEQVAAYLLRHIPQHVLVAYRTQLLKVVGTYSVHGAKFLLQSDFLGNPADTYAVAESIAGSDNADATPVLNEYLKEHWSKDAFEKGRSHEEGHYVNIMRLLKLGGSLSATYLQDLPPPLWIAIAYLPLYRECVDNGNGCLLSQRIRGKLFEATKRLGSKLAFEDTPANELLAQLEHCLPQFLLQKSQTRA